MIEEDESKIYEYFPEPGHYSLSQHRTNNDHLFVQGSIHHTSLLHNQRGNDMDCRSECSDSSISSILSSKQPLENMSKDDLLRVYHSGRRKLDLSNIVGMSEALSREKLLSNTNLSSMRPSLQSLPQPQRNSYLKDKKQRIINSQNTFKSCRQQESLDFGVSRYCSNIEMIPVQSRQVYRGTQVEENDFREMDSLNMTRSSRSSTKTKLPKNYLALNDFISSSQVGA